MSVPSSSVEVANVTDATSKTFVFPGESHTLGNCLRSILVRNPEVDFCGYSIPHPSDNKMNLRLQTKQEPADEVLFEGLETTVRVAESLEAKYEAAMRRFQKKQMKR